MRLIAAAVLLAACAVQKPAQKPAAVAYSTPGQAKPKGKMVCTVERDTGSNMMEKVCTYEEQRDASDTGADDAMIKMNQRAAQHVQPGM